MATISFLSPAPRDKLEMRGRILNVASTAAFVPGPWMSIYYATKAFLLSFSQAIDYELEPNGISVTTLCPGPTESEFKVRAGSERSRLFEAFVMDAPSVARLSHRAARPTEKR
jgi:short-subunit dehydrogenase